MERDHEEREQYRDRMERYIYVVEFTTGIVKVGQASHKEHRVAEHGRAAEKLGAAMSRAWVSERHKEYSQNEEALIAFCAERWPLAGGKEYFAGADFDSVVRYAKTLPMTLVTEAELDEWEQGREEREAKAERFISALSAMGAATRRWREADRKAARDDDEVEPILLEEVAPYEFTDNVTAASAAKRHTAEALINHDLRNKLDPFADIRDWKLALSTAQHGYEISLLLRALIQHAGAEVADKVTRAMWSAAYENCKEYRDDLVAWATEDGTDLDVLSEMTRASYEQIQKLKAHTPPGWVPGQGELPLKGGA